MSNKDLRRHLINMLTRGHSHIMFNELIDDFPAELKGKVADGMKHSAWQLLEHLRICQWDILEFSRDPDHISPPFPEGYWPKETAPPTTDSWDQSVRQFKDNLNQMLDLLSGESRDLFTVFPYGDGQTLLREALVLAMHNSYHFGQLAQIKSLDSKLQTC